jgi:hypothetical protein
MSDLKATPGPWVACPVQGLDYDYRPIARDVASGAAPYHARVDYTGDKAETDANAHLVAAAPELYAALAAAWERVHSDVCGHTCCEECETAKSVMAKARGE